MTNHHRLAFVVVLFAITGSSPGQSVDIKRVSQHVITLNMVDLGYHTNVTVVESEKGLVCIETEITPTIMSKIKAAAEKKLGRSDWVYVINTHNHMHHAGGNVLFKDIPIIGPATMNLNWLENRLSTEDGRHQYCRGMGVPHAIEQLQQGLVDSSVSPLQKAELKRRLEFCREIEREVLAGFEVVNPTVPVADRDRLDLGDVHLQMTYWGDGICHSAIFVQVVEDKLLVGNGMGKAWMPDFYGQPNQASLQRAVRIWQELADEDFPVDRIVGVHSAELIVGREQFHHRAVYLETLLADLTRAKQQGMTLEQAKEPFALGTRYAPLLDYFTQPDDMKAAHQKNIDKIWPLLGQDS